jgi:hypothetical protein
VLGVLEPECDGNAGEGDGVVVSVLDDSVESLDNESLLDGLSVLLPATFPKLISLLPCVLVLVLRSLPALGSPPEPSNASAMRPPTSTRAIAAPALPSILYFSRHSLIAVNRRRIGIETP